MSHVVFSEEDDFPSYQEEKGNPSEKEGNFQAKTQQTAHWILFKLFPLANKYGGLRPI